MKIGGGDRNSRNVPNGPYHTIVPSEEFGCDFFITTCPRPDFRGGRRHFVKTHLLGAPGWLSPVSDCLRLRS